MIGAVLLAILGAALGAARPSSGAAPGAPYVVKQGDTLWSIARARTHGDLRQAVWEIRSRNHLKRGAELVPGTVIRLP